MSYYFYHIYLAHRINNLSKYSETTNPNFRNLFDQLEQVLQVLFAYLFLFFCQKSIWLGFKFENIWGSHFRNWFLDGVNKNIPVFALQYILNNLWEVRRQFCRIVGICKLVYNFIIIFTSLWRWSYDYCLDIFSWLRWPTVMQTITTTFLSLQEETTLISAFNGNFMENCGTS